MSPLAVVTGTTRGLGLAIKSELEQRDWTVISNHGDITDPDIRFRIREEVGNYSRINLLVNNAAILNGTMERVLAVNVCAPFHLINELSDLLDKSPNPIVVNISSSAATDNYIGFVEYRTSKSALLRITQVLALEKPHWNVIAFDPGQMHTDMNPIDAPPPIFAAQRLMDLINA